MGRLSESFNHMLDRVNEMIYEITDTQERKRKAESDMLQAQINPHFLFNVLNSIRMKVLGKGDKESANMISSLSKLLRMTIDKNKETITFREEIQIVSDYINIMNMRQKEQVKVEIDVHEEANTLMIPRFILQPIIENSIIHGLNKRAGTIVVSTERRENQLVIIIEDNGQGMDEASLSQLKSRINHSNCTENIHETHNSGFSSLGLSNVYERMFITFGKSFTMDIKSLPGAGTKVILTIQKGGNILMYKVMLVDDDYPVLQLLSETIEWEQLGVSLQSTHENGASAYEEAMSEMPDILITDIGMPKMNGIELTKKLKSQNPNLKVAILSCHSDFKHAHQALKLQVQDYLVKDTFNLEDLTQLIKKFKDTLDEQNNKIFKQLQIQNMLDRNKESVKERFIKKTIEHPDIIEKNWLDEAKTLGLHLDQNGYIGSMAMIHNFSSVKERFLSEDSLNLRLIMS